MIKPAFAGFIIGIESNLRAVSGWVYLMQFKGVFYKKEKN